MAFREKLKKIKWKRYIFYAVIMVFLTVCLFYSVICIVKAFIHLS